MSQVLADTSVWVELLRAGNSPSAKMLVRLLQEGLVCIHGLVRAELLSGTRTPSEYRELDDSLSALELLPDPPDLWDRVARARFHLARKGHQAAIADLVVAVAASYNGRTLFTLDRDFLNIQTVLKFDLLKT